jgi:hypothetical protein
MRRSLAQPTLNSTSRPNIGVDQPAQQNHSRPQRFQQEALFDQQSTSDQSPPGTISARRKSALQPSLSLPKQPDEVQLTPGPKSPAYLQGKNPYGQVLDKIEHPYRETKVAGTEPPPQLGASAQGRPRTTGAFEFKTRPSPATPERKVHTLDPELRQLPRWQPAKPVSGQATKDFFESKASQNRLPPRPVPSETATIGKTIGKGTKARQIPPVEPPPPSSHDETVIDSVAYAPQEQEEGDRKPVLPIPTEAGKYNDTPQQNVPYTRLKYKAPAAEQTSQDCKSATHRGSIDGSIDVHREVNHFAAKGLTHDGSSSDPPLSRRGTTRDDLLTANIGVQPNYQSIEIPDHVDWRSAYGRRMTQDFGFPGARIRTHGPERDHKPLCDPGDWIKRSCGHSLHVRVSEARNDASQRPCRPCSGKNASLTIPSSDRLEGHERATTASPVSKSSSSTTFEVLGHEHHSGCIPEDACGGTFAQDLSHIIDAILEEHTSSIQDVIDNIKQRPSSLAQLRLVSQDLLQSSQIDEVCNNSSHSLYGPSCTHQTLDQPYQLICLPVCQSSSQPTAQPHGRDWLSLFPNPYYPPKAVEKLNVRSPGQLKPNMNDPRSWLQRTVQTVPDLVDLVSSVADNLGVDLDRRPTARDEQLFREAPVQD